MKKFNEFIKESYDNETEIRENFICYCLAIFYNQYQYTEGKNKEMNSLYDDMDNFLLKVKKGKAGYEIFNWKYYNTYIETFNGFFKRLSDATVDKYKNMPTLYEVIELLEDLSYDREYSVIPGDLTIQNFWEDDGELSLSLDVSVDEIEIDEMFDVIKTIRDFGRGHNAQSTHYMVSGENVIYFKYQF